ncbi:MAG: hypothetical protein Q7V88_08440 [Actinomycetota bacterium]|nr:hypothetical protein [Actinomycetota bacterium]
MIRSGLLLLVIVAAGVGLCYWLPPSVRLRWEERLAVGAVLGIVAFCTTTFGMFLLAGMRWPTVLVGAGVPLVAGAAGWYRARQRAQSEARSALARLRLPTRRAASLRPHLALTLAAGAVATRTLSLAYQTTPQGVSVGNLAIYGDWSAHLAYAGSFAYGDNRGLRSPIAAGTPLRYHFLSDFFAAPFTVTGSTLPQALTLTAWVLAVVFAPLLLSAVLRLTGSRLTAGLALLVFTLSGGVGVWYFVRDLRDQGWSALSPIPRTYARMPDEAIWLDNTISVSLYAQRSTLMGLCIGLAALVLLLSARVTRARAGFVVAGVLAGVCGIVFVHMLLSALALGALAWLFDRRRREWLLFLLPAAVIGLPMAWAIRPPNSEMRWLVGWMAAEEHQSWPWFWLRNAGLFLPLFALIAVVGAARRRLLRLSMPFWLWFIAANLISFHPWSGNNAKFFLFWQLAGSVVIADALRTAWVRRPVADWRWARPAARVAARVMVGAMVVALTVTGSIDTVRGMQREASFGWVAADEMVVAAWLRAHAGPDDVLVYGATNTSAVAALGGVPALSGYPGWTADLGLPDWYTRQLASEQVLRGEPGTDAVVADALAAAGDGVLWVAIGPLERGLVGASDQYWAAHGELVVQAGEYRLYRAQAPAGRS